MAGTSLRRLNMKGFHEVGRAIPVAHIAGQIPSASRKQVTETLRAGGLLSPKAFEELVIAVSQLSPDTPPILPKWTTPSTTYA